MVGREVGSRWGEGVVRVVVPPGTWRADGIGPPAALLSERSEGGIAPVGSTESSRLAQRPEQRKNTISVLRPQFSSVLPLFRATKFSKPIPQLTVCHVYQ